MRKVLAFNMTLAGVCDNTARLADEETLQHYMQILDNRDVILYERITPFNGLGKKKASPK